LTTLELKNPADVIFSPVPALSRIVAVVDTPIVDALLTKALNEVFKLTLSPITPDMLVVMGGQIRANYGHLKIEEVCYVLKKGINNGYGKIYGHLNYTHIAEWLSIYDLDERDQKIVEYNKEKQNREKVQEWDSSVTNLIKSVADKMTATEKAKAPITVDRDGQQLDFLKAFADNLTRSDMERYHAEAVKLGFLKCTKYLYDKLNDTGTGV